MVWPVLVMAVSVAARGDPKVDQVNEIARGDQDVGRLDVAMHQSRVVGAVECSSDLLDDRDRTSSR
jgi:hypothetical protein